MKFLYQKLEPKIITPDSFVQHIWTLEGTDFMIRASRNGVEWLGWSGFFQPVDEERKLPENFRELIVRMADAFEIAFKEQQKDAKETVARQMLLGAK